MLQETTKQMLTVYPPEQQGSGAFDGGKITEIKPIGFPGEGSAVKRIGPLFYWAWATAKGRGKIGLHAHKGFEIISYVLRGSLGHYDTLGNESHVGEGGAQVMQTGSGVSHEEEMRGEGGTEFFQIWFEPHLEEAVKRSPRYIELRAQSLRVQRTNGVSVTPILGKDGGVDLVADSRLDDVIVEPGQRYPRTLDAGRTIAAVVVEGTGRTVAESDNRPIKRQDFVVVDAETPTNVAFHADGDSPLRLVIAEAPQEVDYPLYSK